MPDAINTLPVPHREVPMSAVNANTTPCFDASRVRTELTTSNVQQAADGPSGSCLVFNGTSSYIDVPAGTDLLGRFAKKDFTISVWVKIKLWRYVVIFDATTDANNFVQMRIHPDGKVCLYCRYGGGNMKYTMTGPALKLDTWYHIAVVNNYADGAAEKIYINGQEVACSQYEYSRAFYAGASGKVAIGRLSSPQLHFNGSLALFRLYGQTLDTAQVRAIMAQDQTGLVARLSLDEIPTDGSLTVHGADVVADDLLGGCLKFDGVDDYANMALPSTLSSLATGELTITLWIRGADLSGSKRSRAGPCDPDGRNSCRLVG